MSSAKDSALPLCGVAEARISASLFGEQPGEPVVLGGVVGDVVRLVDDHGVPVLLLQVGEVAVGLERVDRDDRALVVGERVAVGRQLLPDPLDADRVEPDERQREPGPQLELHLLQHVARRDDEDPLAAAASDQLGEDHADLERLAEADRVGEQDPRAQVVGVERLADGGLLVGQRVEQALGGDGQARVGQRHGGLAQRRLEPQPRLRNPGLVSTLTVACAGSSGVILSSAVEKVACVSRTSSLRPWTSTNQPSVARSVRVTSQVSSRISRTEPGAAKSSARSLVPESVTGPTLVGRPPAGAGIKASLD